MGRATGVSVEPVPRVSGMAEQLLTAADGLGPAPDPTVLALALGRPCQHQIRGAAVVDLVPKAKSGPRPHRAHGDAWAGAVASCEGAEGGGVSRDPPAWPLALLTAPSSRTRLQAPEPLPPRAAVVSRGCGWGAFRSQAFQLSGLPVPPGLGLHPPQNPGQVPAEKPISRGDTALPKPRESALKRWATPSGGIAGCGETPASLPSLPLHGDRSFHPRPHAPEKQGHERQAQERSRSSTRGRQLDVTRGPAAGSGVTSHRPMRGAPRQQRADRGAQSCARPGDAGQGPPGAQSSL